MSDKILRSREVAKLLNILPKTLLKLSIPYFTLVRNTRRYRLDAVVAWVKERELSNAAKV